MKKLQIGLFEIIGSFLITLPIILIIVSVRDITERQTNRLEILFMTKKKAAAETNIEQEEVKATPKNAIQSFTDSVVALLPKYEGVDGAELVKVDDELMCYAAFIQDHPSKFNIPDLGEVDLSSVHFSLIAQNPCEVVYVSAEKKYVVQADGYEATMALMLLTVNVDGEYRFFVKSMLLKRSLMSLSNKLHNLNIDCKEALKGTILESRPYLVARAGIELTERSTKEGTYFKVCSFTPVKPTDEVLEQLHNYLTSDVFAKELKDSLEYIEKFLNGDN